MAESGGIKRFFRPYRTVDYLTQGYALLVAALVTVFHGDSVPGWPYYVLVHVLVMVGVHALILADDRLDGRLLSFVRGFYPILLYTGFYLETHHLQFMFQPHHLDAFFIALEQRIFGFQPSRKLVEWLPYWWSGELLYFSYFTYYIMVVGIGLGLYPRDRRCFLRYVTVVSLVFYACYLTYIFLPVMGPYAAPVVGSSSGAEALIGPRNVSPAVRNALFYHVMGLVYHYAEVSGGAAFPSSHVAVALASLTFTWRYLREVRWLHLVFVVLLCVSTVYCGYHYAVDVFGGALTAAALVPLAEWLYRKTEHLGTPLERGRATPAD
ncbi:MAG: phosphatase PAP2 family protein [Planctomycetota bacterium]